MRIYVDELPERCATCPCSEFNFDYGYGCNMLDVAIKDADLKNESCPLQSLSDYTKQVRKEVVQDIKQEVKKLIESKDFGLCNHEYANGYCYGLQYDLAKILDQIQGE